MIPTPETQTNSSAGWLTAPRIAGLIAILPFALYPGIFLGTHSFFFRDYGVFTYPVAYFEHENFWRGEVPLWNPLNNCGVPFLAQWNTSVCYPPSLIFMLLPLPQSLNYFLLGHLVLAGVGMYLLARRWTENNLAAGVAGIVFALNGLMLNSLIWTSNLAALSWQPLVMLCVEQAWRNGGRKKMILAALAGAMQMLSGAPEIILFTWTILGALWCSQIIVKKIPFALSLKRIVIIAALVTGLSAIQLLPFFDLLKYSDRSIGTTGADAFPMPVWGWANLFVPIFRCSQDTFGAWLQPRQAWTSSYYLGIGTLALAFVATWRLRKPIVWILAIAAFCGLILALGNEGLVYSWLKYIFPWINFARYPIKFVSIPVFAIPLLAAFGVKILQSENLKISKLNERTLFSVAVFFFLIVIGLLAAERLLDADSPWRDVWRDGALRILFLGIVVVIFFVFNRAAHAKTRVLAGIVLLAATVFDLITAGLNQNPVVVTKAFGPLEFNMTDAPKFGESRAMLGRQVSTALFYASTTNPVYYFAGVRGALFENCNVPEHIPKVDGFFSLHLKNQQRIHDILYGAHLGENLTNSAPAPLMDFLGISQISDTNIFVWQERKTFLPLITAGQRPVFEGTQETLKQIASDNFDPRHEVYLPPEARDEISATNASSAKISDATFSSQKIQFNVEAPEPAMAVIAQSYYHNWRAYVDDRPAHLWEANDAFQALEVSAGNHQIVLRYEDWFFRVGAIISAVTLAGCLVGLFFRTKEQDFDS